MDGLIIKKRWLDLILSGQKTIEVRGRNTTKYGEIYLLESKTQLVRGKCRLVGTIQYIKHPASYGESLFHGDIKYHCIDKSLNEVPYKRVYGWIFDQIQVLPPVQYKHPKGAVIWVKNVEELIDGGNK